MNFNKAIIAGRIVRDPELKALPSGSKVANFSMATNRVWLQDGVKKEQVDFHNIIAFGKQAETIAQYVKQGQLLLIEGRIQTRSWDGKDGKKNYRTEIVTENFQFGPKASGTTQATGTKKVAAPRDEVDTIEFPDDESQDGDEDIPF